jgi:NAD(P)-dependent dehydrogenase (short-subunit alcohol dehydrogenase family)
VASLDGQVVLVTGATDGLGRALAADLVGAGAIVLVHGRDPGRIAATVEELTARAGAEDRVRSYQADLADLGQVRALADRVIANEPRLDVLVNNAGIGNDVPGGGVRQESTDGYELRFAVNYLAGFLLTRLLLLPLLLDSAPSRIVNVSSAGQQAIDFDDVMLTSDYSGMRAYRQSKLAQILFTVDLARQLDGTGVTVNALHPATFMPTKIVASPISTIPEGVEATMHLITAPVSETSTGHYYSGLSQAQANPQAYDQRAQTRLRELSEKLTS